MKIRNGFVSNSSSSSFLIHGAYIRETDIKNIGIDINSEMTDMADCEGLTCHLSDYGDSAYIGLSYECIKDDETGTQFKERATKLVNEFLKAKTPIPCESISYAWFNG